jgi:crotonobetainyl-CoA:carnitine CoA-transferase CaiB-like acyl-CoA transferase
MVIAVGNDRQFRALCEGLGIPELAADGRFATNPDRVAHAELLAGHIAARLSDQSAATWFSVLTPLGVPCGPVNDLAAAFAFATELGLGPSVTVGAGEESVSVVANPIALSATPPTYRLRPPGLGEHSAELRRWLEPPMSFRPDACT